jgi:ankyrin repeat protein
MTPLHVAIAMGHHDAVETLLRSGADIDDALPD